MRHAAWLLALAAFALPLSALADEMAQQGVPSEMPMDTMDHGAMDGMDHGEDGAMGLMSGAFGSYPMSREASGTSWQPDSTPVQGMHLMSGDWALMFDGFVNGVYDRQGGPRGGHKTFSSSMAMGMAQRRLGDGTLGLRAMVSLDPLMGRNGYPLLLATGETADGRTSLVDRQHPHDFLMELATSYSLPLSDESSAFVYFGYPGEPALGPPTFMHRFSGMDNPEAPISHHWLDSTHIVFGVATFGYVYDQWKIEGSAFTGREPDQRRWNFDSASFDSGSARLTFNPGPNWSMQTSYGRINSPEQLHPTVDEDRVTASVTYNRPIGDDNWATTFAWGRKMMRPGEDLDAYLLESAFTFDTRHTVFGRVERADEHELFEHDSPLSDRTFTVGKLSLGYVYDIPIAEHVKLGFGALGSLYDLPGAIQPAYGGSPTSYMLFMRLKIM